MRERIIVVRLVNWGIVPPKEMISHGGLACYKPHMPDMGEVIDTKGRLFDVGHLTTHRHPFFTFDVEGISVAGVTFGLHLNHPFYNTGQRSGRFSRNMFENPDMNALATYLEECWSLDAPLKAEIMAYLDRAFGVYQAYIKNAVEVAAIFIKKERPFATAGSVDPGKIAQEQMRMVIPVIFSTALVHTVNLSALAALYRVAWSPEMRELTGHMVACVLEKWPELEYMFTEREYPEGEIPCDEWFGMPSCVGGVAYEPKYTLIRIDDVPPERRLHPSSKDLHPVNTLFFSPKFMEYNVNEVKARVRMSLATYGQKERHLTVRRGRVRFIGDFYLPPILRELGLEHEAELILQTWSSFRDRVPASLFVNLAPYGAMVEYEEVASFNAAICELSKRLCLCAQEEVYHLGDQERRQVEGSALSEFLKPPCLMTGKCGEGVRYCGRDLKKLPEDPFPKRRV